MTPCRFQSVARCIGTALGVLVVMVGCGWEQELGSRSDTYPGGEDAAIAATDDVPDGVPVSVGRVIDGDSLEVLVGSTEIELRLEGYNAPELYTDDSGGTDVQTCNGLAARRAVADVVDEADTVAFVEGDRDRFGRTLGDLIIDGGPLTELLIAEGRGLATGDDKRRRDLMVEAARSGVGVWGTGCGEPEIGKLSIGEIQVDAPGNDRFNLAEEYVQVVNAGADAIDLTGWVIRDDTTSHQFPLAGTLAAGERLTIVTGGERPESIDGETFLLRETFPVWSNEWETVILVDPAGVFGDWRFVAEGRVLLE